MISGRSEVIRMICAAKAARNITWAEAAQAISQSKEWTASACPGQMAFTKEQAGVIGAISGLPQEAIAWLQIPPCKGSQPMDAPAEPLISSFPEIIAVYGPAIKELIHEQSGGGIMSAAGFSIAVRREADPKGDRVKIVLSGKFLPYKAF